MATPNLIWNQDRIISRARATMLKRGQIAADVVERDVKDRISTPYPPASRPGQPPHARIGALGRSILGEAKLFINRVRVTISASAPYAVFLQRGTSRMAARPFVGLPSDARTIVDILSGRRRG